MNDSKSRNDHLNDTWRHFDEDGNDDDIAADDEKYHNMIAVSFVSSSSSSSSRCMLWLARNRFWSVREGSSLPSYRYCRVMAVELNVFLFVCQTLGRSLK